MFGKVCTLFVTLGICLALGCGSSSRSQGEIDEAQEAVNTALTAWKSKKSLKSLENTSSIQVIDSEWKAGLQLLDFKIQKTEGLEGKSLRSSVVLSLKDSKGRKSESDAVYVITLGREKKIVAREFFD